jgi:hypothetical protein
VLPIIKIPWLDSRPIDLVEEVTVHRDVDERIDVFEDQKTGGHLSGFVDCRHLAVECLHVEASTVGDVLLDTSRIRASGEMVLPF